MTPPESHYEDELFTNDLPLPPSMQWEAMEEGIIDKMAAIKAKRRRRRFLFWLFPTVLVGCIALGFWAFQSTQLTTTKPPLAASKTQNQLQDDCQSISPILNQENKDNKQQENQIVTEKTAKKDDQPASSQTAKTFNAPSPLGISSSSQPNTASIQKTIQQEKPQPYINNKSAIEIQAAGITAVTQAPAGSISNEAVVASSIQEKPISPTRIALPSASDFIDKLDYTLRVPEPDISPEIQALPVDLPKVETDFTPFLRAQVSSGINWFKGNYSGADNNFVMLRKASEYTDPGTQFSLRLEQGFAPNVFVGSGFNYTTYRTKLDTEANTTINRLSSMVLLRFNEDPITGDSTGQQFADTVLTVHQLRRIRHYNRYTSLEIPVYLGYEFQLNRINLALTGGLTASISRQMEGRIFDANGEVVPLGQEQFINYRNNLTMAVTGGLNIGYQLSEKLNVSVGGQYQRFLSNWVENSSNILVTKPSIWSTSLGLGWKF